MTVSNIYKKTTWNIFIGHLLNEGIGAPPLDYLGES